MSSSYHHPAKLQRIKSGWLGKIYLGHPVRNFKVQVLISLQRRAFDLAMLELFNSKEREKDDWIALLESAHPSFRMVGITQPPGSNLSFIEIVWDGSSPAKV